MLIVKHKTGNEIERWTDCSSVSARHHVGGLGSLGALLQVVGDTLSLGQGLESLHDNGPEVNKDVALAAVLGDEAEALLLVEPLDGAGAGHGETGGGVDGRSDA